MYNETNKIRINELFDILELVTSSIMILLMIVLIIYSVSYYVSNDGYLLGNKMFDISFFIVLITVLVEWIDGRIKSISRIFNKHKINVLIKKINKKNERRNN